MFAVFVALLLCATATQTRSASATNELRSAFDSLLKRLKSAVPKDESRTAFTLALLATLYGDAAYDSEGQTAAPADSDADSVAAVFAGSEGDSDEPVHEYDLVFDIVRMGQLNTSEARGEAERGDELTDFETRTGWAIVRGSNCQAASGRAPCLFRGPTVSVVGHFSKGKTWLLSRVFGVEPEPVQQLIATRGLSLVQYMHKKHKQKRFTLIDTAGRGPPVVEGQTSFEDRAQLEDMMQEVVLQISNVFIYVVNDLTWEEQREMRQLVDRASRQVSAEGVMILIVVHNLRNWRLDTYHEYVLKQLLPVFPSDATLEHFIADDDAADGTAALLESQFYVEHTVPPVANCFGDDARKCKSVNIRHYFTVHDDNSGTAGDLCVRPQCQKGAQQSRVKGHEHRSCMTVTCEGTVSGTGGQFNDNVAKMIRKALWYSIPARDFQQVNDMLALVTARLDRALARLVGDSQKSHSTRSDSPHTPASDLVARLCGSVKDSKCEGRFRHSWDSRMLRVDAHQSTLVKAWPWGIASHTVRVMAPPANGNFDPRHIVFQPDLSSKSPAIAKMPRVVHFHVPRSTSTARFRVEKLRQDNNYVLFKLTGFAEVPKLLGSFAPGAGGQEATCDAPVLEAVELKEAAGLFTDYFWVEISDLDITYFSCSLSNGVLEVVFQPQTAANAQKAWVYSPPTGATEDNCEAALESRAGSSSNWNWI